MRRLPMLGAALLCVTAASTAYDTPDRPVPFLLQPTGRCCALVCATRLARRWGTLGCWITCSSTW